MQKKNLMVFKTSHISIFFIFYRIAHYNISTNSRSSVEMEYIVSLLLIPSSQSLFLHYSILWILSTEINQQKFQHKFTFCRRSYRNSLNENTCKNIKKKKIEKTNKYKNIYELKNNTFRYRQKFKLIKFGIWPKYRAWGQI